MEREMKIKTGNEAKITTIYSLGGCINLIDV